MQHSVHGELDANGELIKVPVRIIRNSGRDGAVEVGTIMYLPVRSAISLVRDGCAERVRTYAKGRERATRIAHERAILPQ